MRFAAFKREMESPRTRRKGKSRLSRASGTRPNNGISEKAVTAIIAERERFHRFVASRIGDHALAEDLLQESLARALKHGEKLRRGESAVAWFYRILRNAVSDHYRNRASENRRVSQLLADMQALQEDVSAPPRDWDAAVCACFRGLLPALRPRYAQVIRRVDLRGEAKQDVADDMKLSPATMDVLLHRARQALRKRLEILCGACSRERCLECFCERSGEKL